MSSSPEDDEFNVREIWNPEERRYKARLAAGTVLLDHLVSTENFEDARNHALATVTSSDILSFINALMDDMHTIEAMDTLTTKGISLFMLHPHKYLKDVSPLEACVVGEHELALEAARCFADSERGFDPDLAGAPVEAAAERVMAFVR